MDRTSKCLDSHGPSARRAIDAAGFGSEVDTGFSPAEQMRMGLFQLWLVGKRAGFGTERQWTMGEIRTGKVVAEAFNMRFRDLLPPMFTFWNSHNAVITRVDG